MSSPPGHLCALENKQGHPDFPAPSPTPRAPDTELETRLHDTPHPLSEAEAKFPLAWKHPTEE